MFLLKSKIYYLFCLFCICLFIFAGQVYTGDNIINVDINIVKGNVNKKVFGNNLIAYDPSTFENRSRDYYGYSDFGAGIWDPKLEQEVKEVTFLSKEAGITVMRFPGGCGVHHYDWKKAIGKKRNHFLFGMDEFLRLAEILEVDPIITLSYFTGDAVDKADLIEYLNSPNDETNPNGGRNWAKERAKNGHSTPYHVKYFEIGNEVYHGDHRNISKVRPEEYGNRYLKYWNVLKALDPTIKIGAVLKTERWNKKVLAIINDKIDFGIIHSYPSPGISKEELAKMDPKVIYLITMAKPTLEIQLKISQLLKLLRLHAKNDVFLAITEYNGHFVQDIPIPYRHALGTALLNAELLQMFMKPENNILMANYWNFANDYWGMVANGFDGTAKTLNNPYYKRPNYYVFEMYHKHFGDILINADVKCEDYDASVYQPATSLMKRLKTGTLIKKNLLIGGWEIKTTAGVTAVEKNGVLGIEFLDCFVAKNAPRNDTPNITPRNDTCTYNYYHSVKKANVEPNAYYKLSGYIKTDNLIDDKGVCLEVQDGRGWNQTKSAAATEKIKGTTDWQYVEVIYETLPDAKAVNVLARRVGETGPLKGKAYFKDVKLEKFISSLDTKIPYLSVNASKSKDGSKVYLMVINKNMDAPMVATIDLKDFVPAAKGNAWVLNGPSVDATNELKHDNVKVTHREFEIASAAARLRNDTAGAAASTKFEYTFEPHSLTALEIVSAQGTRAQEHR